MVKDERWEPDYNEAGFERETAMYDVANQARAHYEPIVAELRERLRATAQLLRDGLGLRADGPMNAEEFAAAALQRVETLQRKLSESIAREERLENSAESWRRVSEQLQNDKRELDALASRLAADLKGEHESRRTALVHKSLHDQVVAELRERIAELEALEQVCLSWGGSIQALAEDILNTTAVGKRMKEQLDG